MDKSYELTVTRTEAGVPNNVANVDEVSLIEGAVKHVLAFDNDKVVVGPAKLLGRFADATLGAVVETRLKTGSFETPFLKFGG